MPKGYNEPSAGENAAIDPATIRNEDKKWVVDGLTSQLELLTDELQILRDEARIGTERLLSWLVGIRNSILSALTFVITLTLAFMAYEPIKSFLAPLLVANLLVGIITYVTLSIWRNGVLLKINAVDLAYLLAITRINRVKLVFNKASIHLDSITPDQLCFYTKFFIVLRGAVKVELSYALYDAIESIIFWWIKEDLKRAAENIDNFIYDTYAFYKKHEKEFAKHQGLWDEFSFIHSLIDSPSYAMQYNISANP